MLSTPSALRTGAVSDDDLPLKVLQRGKALQCMHIQVDRAAVCAGVRHLLTIVMVIVCEMHASVVLIWAGLSPAGQVYRKLLLSH